MVQAAPARTIRIWNADNILAVQRLFLRNFRPKHHVEIPRGGRVVRLVQDGAELERVLRLRHEVFYEEMLGSRHPLGIDIDRFDMAWDHLVVEELDSGRFVGTYRLNPTQSFYSAGEFDMDRITALPGGKLELGRACIHRDARDGATIGLLWKGVMEYARKIGARYLVGCSSVRTTNPLEILMCYRYLRDRHWAPDLLRVRPRRKHQIVGLEDFARAFDGSRLPLLTCREAGGDLVPPLLRSYLNAGAVICGAPAMDSAFGCVDFLSLLDLEKLGESYARRFR